MEYGLNCQSDEIIENRDTCKLALQKIGLDMLNPNVERQDRPAGCYWGLSGSTGYGYFNSVINPEVTSPNSFGYRGGVCDATGRS